MACVTLVYPENFPCPTWDYGQDLDRLQQRTPFDCGWTRQRLRWPDTASGVQLSFAMTTAIFGVWGQWMENNGYEWFKIPLEVHSGAEPLVYVDIRTVSPITYRFYAHDQVTAQFTGEMRNV